MTIDSSLTSLKQRMEAELRGNILPFWINHMVDHQNGGFYGALTNDLQVRDQVERSLVLCARMLWTYSAAYRLYNDPAYLQMAEHAYRALTGPFVDPAHGGLYWWIDRHGQPVNDRKQTYGQAFAIYGLSEYFLATGKTEALERAQNLFDLIETHAYEPQYGGYVEGCAADWSALPDMRLSDKEPFNCPKSMNTLLHVIEGYTNLLRAWPDSRLQRAQGNLLKAFMDHVVDPHTHFTRLFFEKDWRSLTDHISYGHDIETSWLLVEAAEVLAHQQVPGAADLLERARANAVAMADAVYAQGLDEDGAVLHEGSPAGVHNFEKHWWCQAEGIVGFVNAWQISGDARYAHTAGRIWDFIDAHMIDRQHGEWFKVLDRAGQPGARQHKAGPWEDPYHHARACMEIIQRVGNDRSVGGA